MRNVARRVESEPVFQDVGTVLKRDGARYVVRTAASTQEALRAVSCLVRPEIGDEVLLSFVGTDRCFVLAVLERAMDTPPVLAADGGLRIEADGGALELAARDGVTLSSPKDVNVVSNGLHVTAASGRILIQDLAMLGAVLRAELASVTFVCEWVDSVVERIVEHVKRSYRFIEEGEQMRAKHVDYAAS
jgi:hypothetical protein